MKSMKSEDLSKDLQRNPRISTSNMKDFMMNRWIDRNWEETKQIRHEKLSQKDPTVTVRQTNSLKGNFELSQLTQWNTDKEMNELSDPLKDLS